MLQLPEIGLFPLIRNEAIRCCPSPYDFNIEIDTVGGRVRKAVDLIKGGMFSGWTVDESLSQILCDKEGILLGKENGQIITDFYAEFIDHCFAKVSIRNEPLESCCLTQGYVCALIKRTYSGGMIGYGFIPDKHVIDITMLYLNVTNNSASDYVKCKVKFFFLFMKYKESKKKL